MVKSLARPGPALSRLSAPAAMVWGWALLALVDTVTVELRLRSLSKPAARAAIHFFDIGQHLFAGFLSAAVLVLWVRRGPRRTTAPSRFSVRHWFGESDVMLALVGICLAIFRLPEDLGGAAHKIAVFGSERLWLGSMFVAAGLGAALVFRAGAVLAGYPRIRYLGIAAGLGLGVSNQIVLLNDYQAIHGFLEWYAALLLGGALMGAPFRSSTWIAAKRFAADMVAPFSAIATLSIIVPPTQVANRLLQTVPGAALAPILAKVRAPRPPTVPPATPRTDVQPTRPALIKGPPIVILFVTDALRADVVESEAHAEDLPNIEALRRDSLDFTTARAPASGTVWTISSIFSSRYYSQLYWSTKPGDSPTRSFLRDDPYPRFPSVLSSAKIESFTGAAMSEIENYGDQFGIIRGVTEEHRIMGTKRNQGPELDAALQERIHRGVDGSLFVYVHFLNAHTPYLAGSPKDSSFQRYLAEVKLVDGYLGELQKALRDGGLSDRTVLIFTADHGEAFGEHQSRYHAVSVYEELLRVPLLVHVPGVPPRRVSTPVSLIDLGPTVLDLFGQVTPASFMGQSLTPFLRGQEPMFTRPILAETGRHQRALISDDGFKVIEDTRRHTVEAYDLKVDPKELDDLVDGKDPRVPMRLRQMRETFARNAFRRDGYEPPYRP